MFPQYTERQMGGELAIWLLITVGALLIPLIVIAICCIRHHLPRRPQMTLIESRLPRIMKNTQQTKILRSYNGPFMKSSNDDVGVSSENNYNLTFSRVNSLKKQRVHWREQSAASKNDVFYSREDSFNTRMLTELPSTDRNRTFILSSSSVPSHFIPRAIIPAGSAVHNIGTSQLLLLSTNLMPISFDHNSLV
ncbi:unnamed protein product [Rotaria socialis]|uniref:Uncharacterized protein n=1 Tax=Rotaria socialis TaxID=392032 RepID=A0A821JEW2_9BILA|nr:unnamed protein product [Rotaria socialis]CAF4501042.1 unnamed protein product [Rotaria socialis]CAF4717425.1 unnamed protein product [Rotaria socialis]